MIRFLDDIDTSLFLFLNGINSPLWDQIMYFVSGKLSWIPLYALILFLLFRKYKRRIWLPILAIILLVFVADQTSVHLFKNVFQRLRPCHNPEIKALVHIVNNRCGGQFGFVSSHASNTFALAVFLYLLFKKRYIGVFMLCWACLVSYSRVYLGRHYPGDVIGGALVGVASAYLVYRIFKLTEKKMGHRSS